MIYIDVTIEFILDRVFCIRQSKYMYMLFLSFCWTESRDLKIVAGFYIFIFLVSSKLIRIYRSVL